MIYYKSRAGRKPNYFKETGVILIFKNRMKKIFSLKFIFLFSIIFLGSFLILTKSASAAMYYVDATGGNDGNSGTEAAPWQTLTNPNDAAKTAPGDTIFFKRGGKWRGQLLPPEGGAQESERITYGAYGTGDAPAIIDGKYFVSGTSWTGPNGNGEYYLVIGTTIEFPSAVTNAIRGQSTGVSTYKGLIWGTKDTLAEDSWAYVVNGTNAEVWYKPLAGHNPNEYDWEFAKYKSPIYINAKSYITIDSLRLINGQDHSTQVGVVTIHDSDYVNITNNEIFAGGEMGIAVLGSSYGSITNNLIRGNRSSGVWTETPVNYMTVQGNTIRDNSWGTTANDTAYDRGGVLLNNGTTHNTITGNTIGNNGSTATTRLNSEILLDGTDYATVARNYIYNAWRKGIGMSGTRPNSHHTIQYNVIYNWNLMGADYPWHTAIVIEGVNNTSDDGYHKIENNTIFSNADIALYGINIRNSSTYHIHNTSVKNNIVVFSGNNNASTRGIRFGSSGVSHAGTTETNNLVYGCTNLYEEDGGTFTTVAAWRAYEGLGANDISADPLFISTFTPNFHLQLTSAAISAGTDVSLTADYTGNNIYGTPDIGVYEYQPLYAFASNDISLLQSCNFGFKLIFLLIWRCFKNLRSFL